MALSSYDNHEQVEVASTSNQLWRKIVKFGLMLKKLGQDDPRRIVHSLKVALALTLVSMLFYVKPLYEIFGLNAVWAIITVVVVFEFSVGATIGRGLNRMMTTLVAAALSIGVHRLATHFGNQGEAILIALFVFVEAALVTFLRFVPQLKARFDYGLLIFNLTFCMISVSGYRDDNVIQMSLERLFTVVIGSFTTIVVCIFIHPMWIGVELHNQIASNIEKLGNFLEEFGDQYFNQHETGQHRHKSPSFDEYKQILYSKANEDTMANLARWEPRHGRFRFNHPWREYLKVGALTRQCAFKIDALNNYLNSNTKSPQEVKIIIQGPSMIISSECGKALKEMTNSMRKMNKFSSTELHIAKSKDAVEDLKANIRASLCKLHVDSLQIIQQGAMVSLLFEVITCVEKISEAVYTLAAQANFKDVKPIILLNEVNEGPHHVVAIDR